MNFINKTLIFWTIAYLLPTITSWIIWPDHMFSFRIAYDAAIYYHINMPLMLFIAFLIAFMVFMYPLVPNKEEKRYGSAKYGNKKTIKALELNAAREKGIILGKYQKKFLVMARSLSIMIFAPPGTGKTTSVIIPTLLFLKNSVVTTDFKGELFKYTSGVRSLFSKVIYFNPTDPKSKVFNPFDNNIIPEDILDHKSYASNISQILIKSKEEEDYFAKAARDAFGFFASWLMWKDGETSISGIREKIVSSSNIPEIIEGMVEDLEDSKSFYETNDEYQENKEFVLKALKQDANSVLVAANSDEQWAGVMGTLTASLAPFSDPRVAKATSGKSDIIPRNLRKERTSIYLVIPDKDRKRLAPIMNMIFETIGTELISKEAASSDMQVTFLLDEFIRLGKLETVVSMPDISRSYKVNMVFVAQDFAQVKTLYKQDQLDTLFSTCAFKVIFQQNNQGTAEQISKMVGKATLSKESRTKSSKELIRRDSSVNLSEEGLELLSAQNIMNLDEDKVLILGQGQMKHPIMADKASYFLDKEMKKLIKENEHKIELLY